jgi:hypothetical protein
MNEVRTMLRAVSDYTAFYGSMLTYRVRLGRRFDPPPDVDGFMAELEHYYHSELRTSLHQ